MIGIEKVFTFIILSLSNVKICYSREIPKYRHVSITYYFPSDEYEFLPKLNKSNVHFEEGERSYDNDFNLVQEYIVRADLVSNFETVVQELRLSRTNYTEPREEYVTLFLPLNTAQFLKNLKTVGINLEKIRRRDSTSIAYVVEADLIPEVKNLAQKLGIPKIVHGHVRLSRVYVTFSHIGEDDILFERLKIFHMMIEKGAEEDLPDNKWVQEYFIESRLLDNFTYFAKLYGLKVKL